MTDWVYPDYFKTLTDVANWIAVVSVVCCVFLLLSWAFLPVEKTNRHYLSMCLTIGVMLMNVSVLGYQVLIPKSLTMISLASSFPLQRNLINVMTRLHLIA